MINDTNRTNVSQYSCSRCQGLMAPESCFNLHYDAGEMEILTWRCLQCGELIDPIILRNRTNPLPNAGRRKPRPSLPNVQRTSRTATLTSRR